MLQFLLFHIYILIISIYYYYISNDYVDKKNIIYKNSLQIMLCNTCNLLMYSGVYESLTIVILMLCITLINKM